MPSADRPLAGIRVADFSRVLAGPFATQRLADLGADVIKVERPGSGDETRSWGPPFRAGVSSYFSSLNRGKRSMAVDLGSESGREVTAALCAGADVVVHNFLPGTASKLGLDHASIEAARPDVISCVISGFGASRMPSGRAGYDLIVEAESGLMAITGAPDGEPSKVGVAIVDVLTGLEAATSIVAALASRERGAGGASIEVALLDSAMAALVNVGQGALDTGSEPRRWGNDHPSIVPYGPFPVSDGRIVIAAANDGLWVRLCAVLGLDELVSDPRFATNPDRVDHRDELEELLSARLSERTGSDWIGLLDSHGVPCGRVLGVIEAVGHAEAAGDPVTVELDGGLEVMGPPARFSGTRLHATSAPPTLGEHTDEVLLELGFDADRVGAMRSEGSVA